MKLNKLEERVIQKFRSYNNSHTKCEHCYSHYYALQDARNSLKPLILGNLERHLDAKHVRGAQWKMKK